MASVCLVTNFHLKCGSGAYGRDLLDAFSKYFQARATDNWEEVFKVPSDVVVINWQPGRMNLESHLLNRIKSQGSKLIVIYQDTHDGPAQFGDDHPLALADMIVAHEPVSCRRPLEFIPVGIWRFDNLGVVTEPKIGVAGFPFQWKNFDVTAEAAKIYGVKCLLIAPTYEGVETDTYVEGIRGHLGGLAEVRRNWMSNESVVHALSECTLNIFWYGSRSGEDQLGQSGSVRMGIAAGRPMIISRHRKFKTLMPYAEEFYVADTTEQVYEFAGEILKNEAVAYRPKRILEEMGWPKTALLWKDLIERLVLAEECVNQTTKTSNGS